MKKKYIENALFYSIALEVKYKAVQSKLTKNCIKMNVCGYMYVSVKILKKMFI